MRASGELSISPALRQMLAAIRAHEGITAAPEVALEDLQAIEARLGGYLADDLVAFLVATGRSLGALGPLTEAVADFYAAEGVAAWRSRFRFAHAAFDDGYSEEGPLCVALGAAEPPPIATLVVWTLLKGAAWAPTFETPGESPVMAYGRWKYPSVDFASAVDATVEPRVVVPVAPPPRRVTHPKFGEGLVIAAIAPDKVEVDFGVHGVRKLLASTVRDAG